MGFNTPADAGEIINARTFGQGFGVYLVTTPISIIWQGQVNDTKTADDYASFAWDNQSGSYDDYTDVIEGQLCFVTTAANIFTDPVIRGRVRKVPNGGTFFIDETGNDIDDTMFITVIDDYPALPRKPRANPATLELYKDWDLVYRNLPPIITGLPSVQIDDSGAATVTKSYAPAPEATALGATIVGHLWSVGDGNITAGSTTTENITVEWPGAATNEWRWVHYTATDSNGIAQAFHFQVYTVNNTSSVVIPFAIGNMTINSDWETGYTADFTAWDDFDANTILAESRVTVFSHPYYDTTQGVPDETPIGSNIMFMGWLSGESEAFDLDESRRIDSAQLTAQGMGTQMLQMAADNLPITDTATPSTWGDINAPDITRVSVYFLAYHTTFASIASLQFDDLSGYRASGNIWGLNDEKAQTTITSIANTVNANLNYAPDGTIAIRRDAVYLSDSDRNALATIFDFDIDDGDIKMRDAPLTYGLEVTEVTLTGIVYSTSVKEISGIFEGLSPNAHFGQGYERVELNNQILLSDVSDDTAKAELGQRTGNHYAAVNPKPIFTMQMRPGFYWMIPTRFQWWTHTIPATYSVRGRAYTSSDRWLLQSISLTIDFANGTMGTEAEFIAETIAGNAGINVTRLPVSGDAVYDYPPYSPYDTLPTDPEAFGSTGYGLSVDMEPQPPGYNQDSELGFDRLSVKAHGGVSRATANSTVLGEPYICTVRGDCQLDKGFFHLWNFTQEDGGFTLFPFSGTSAGEYTVDTGWVGTSSADYGDENSGIYIERSFAQRLITKASLSGDWIAGQAEGYTIYSGRIILYLSGGLVDDSGEVTFWGYNKTVNLVTSVDADQIRLFVQTSKVENPPTDNAGESLYSEASIEGTGTDPITGESEGTQGDAFYYNYVKGDPTLYIATLGLRVDGNKPSSIPDYSPNHQYTWIQTGTGAPFNFSFTDFGGANLPQANFNITVEGEDMNIY